MMTVAECIKYVEDHMEVRYATKNGAYRSGRKIDPEGSVNHSVGCAQPSVDVFFNLMNSSSAGWGVNALIGDFHKGEGRIILCMDLTTRPWGCASGRNGSWNNTKIQWEICEPAGHTYAGGTMIGYDVVKNQVYFDRMWKMVVAWNVYCCVKFGYPVSGISDHAESYKAGYGSNHSDISQWIPKHGKTMNNLRAEVEAILNYVPEPEIEIEEDEDMTVDRFKELYEEMRKGLQDNDAAQWSADARAWAVDSGLVQGGSSTEFNGMWQDVLTREQMITIMYRFAKMMGAA